jgi:hypothetical protein
VIWLWMVKYQVLKKQAGKNRNSLELETKKLKFKQLFQLSRSGGT